MTDISLTLSMDEQLDLTPTEFKEKDIIRLLKKVLFQKEYSKLFVRLWNQIFRTMPKRVRQLVEN